MFTGHLSRRLVVATFCLLITHQASASTSFTWRIERFANEFWVLDNISAWDGDPPNLYRTTFEERFGLSADRKELLLRYATVRRAHSQESVTPPTVHAPWVSMIPPPPLASERFAQAFFRSPDERTASETLKLTPAETDVVLSTFKTFRPQIDALLKDSEYLEGAKEKLSQEAERSHMADFLEQMKTFYEVRDHAPYVVHLLWAPPGFGQATVWDHDVVLPLTRKAAEDEKDLASWLGVLVHECGHAFLSERSEKERADLSQRITNRGGAINQRHSNIIDEATQTALGNIIFVRDRLPASFDPISFYNYEPRNQFPDAIDSLARELEPILRAALDKKERFGGRFLEQVLDVQARLFGNTPLHHSHVGLVFTENRGTERQFNGLFWGRTRFKYDSKTLADFVRDSRANRTLTRWVLLTSHEATADIVSKLEMPVAKTVSLGAKAACARAMRRQADGGYDFFVLGKDTEALRRILIALQRAQAMPESKPLCVIDPAKPQAPTRLRVSIAAPFDKQSR